MNKFLLSIFLFFMPFLIFAQAPGNFQKGKEKRDSVSKIVDPKADQKELVKNLKEAKVLSLINQKPNFEQARKKIKAAMRNSQYEVNKADVLYEAGNVEYNCYETERNKPASGAKINLSVLYPATEKGFRYLSEAYNIYNTPNAEGKVIKKNNSAIQKKAWALFHATDGFRANAGQSYQNKDWKTAHKCFNLFLAAIESPVINDYVKMKPVLDLYQADSTVFQVKYFRAVCALKMDSTELAIHDLDAIKLNDYEQNTVLQELSKLYLSTNNRDGYEETLRLGLKYLPQEPWFARNLVNLYLNEKFYNEANEVVDHLMEVDGDNPANLSLKGQLVELSGNDKDALELYEMSYALDSMNVTINSNIARVYFNQATFIENEYFEQRLYEDAYMMSIPTYIKSMEYYKKAFELDESHKDQTIAKAIRTITYKQFSRADCPNQAELIDLYNKVSRAYNMETFPR